MKSSKVLEIKLHFNIISNEEMKSNSLLNKNIGYWYLANYNDYHVKSDIFICFNQETNFKCNLINIFHKTWY